jgi:hypothetical protein
MKEQEIENNDILKVKGVSHLEEWELNANWKPNQYFMFNVRLGSSLSYIEHKRLF